MLTAAERSARAGSVRIGNESAGHYHQAFATTLRRTGFDMVELNPYQVKMARAHIGRARLRTDPRDCLAMAGLFARDQGWPLYRENEAASSWRGWDRRRKAAAAQVLGGQVHGLPTCSP